MPKIIFESWEAYTGKPVDESDMTHLYDVCQDILKKIKISSMQDSTNKIAVLFSIIILLSSCWSNKNGKYCKQPEDNVMVCRTYKEGLLIRLETFENDTTSKNGPYIEFSPRGDTLVKAYYRDNKKIGGYYLNHPQNQPKEYIYFDYFHEDTMYFRGYNTKGQITKEYGELFHEDYYTTVNTRELDTDSTLEIISVLITPPRTSFKVGCFMVDIDNIIDTIMPIKTYYLPYQNEGAYSTMFKMKEPGRYRVFVLSELYDPDKNKTWRKEQGYDFNFAVGKN